MAVPRQAIDPAVILGAFAAGVPDMHPLERMGAGAEAVGLLPPSRQRLSSKQYVTFLFFQRCPLAEIHLWSRR